MPDDPSTRRLLVMDDHGSHITANVISFCMNNAIGLLILPPHTSHLLQPLDISVFGPLKQFLAAETDAASRLDPGRIQRVEWTETYIRARSISSNIKCGLRATGLSPLSRITVLEKVWASSGIYLPSHIHRCVRRILIHRYSSVRHRMVRNFDKQTQSSIPNPADLLTSLLGQTIHSTDDTCT